MKTIVAALFILNVSICYTQDSLYHNVGLPGIEIYGNTFRIKTDSLMGTSFVIIHKDEEYLVTSKHLFKEGKTNKDLVHIYLNRDFFDEPFYGNIFLHKLSNIDLAVIKLPRKISNTSSYKINKDIVTGQDCYFLGFPAIGVFTHTNIGMAPFVKKAIVSASYIDNGIEIILLDGHNNQGFSGGPVVGYDGKNKRNSLISVISGYLKEKTSNIERIDAADKVYKIDENFRYLVNSGIIISYPARYIIEIIEQNTSK